jgi:hypothetical protein
LKTFVQDTFILKTFILKTRVRKTFVLKTFVRTPFVGKNFISTHICSKGIIDGFLFKRLLLKGLFPKTIFFFKHDNAGMVESNNSTNTDDPEIHHMTFLVVDKVHLSKICLEQIL